MTNAIYRYGLPLIPGSVVTFLLLLFMVALVFTNSEAPPEVDTIKLPNIFHTPSGVEPVLNPPKPTKPPEVTAEPERTQPPPETGPVVAIRDPIIHKMGKQKVGGPVLDRDPIPVYAAQPEYPARALTRGISGYAVVSLTISPTGATRDTTLIAESPEGYGFGKAALKAAGKLKYQPRMVDGEATAVPGVTFRYSFNLEE